MIKIGIISDTHGYLDKRIISFFKNVDIIFHAGDIGNTEIIKMLRNIAKTYAVFGNIDNSMIRSITKKVELVKIEGVKVLMTHIGGYPDRYYSNFYNLINAEKPNIVVTGHSHILKVVFDKKLNHLHINPGAFGNNGFHKVKTAVRLTIDNTNIKDLEILELERV